MVSAAKAFAKEPPREPLKSVEAIVRDFHWRYVERKKTDQVINYCAEAPNLKTAIDRAVRARDANGKHHNHQSKVDLDARLMLGRDLYLARRTVRACADFDTLHDFIDEIKPYGIGPVTVYDVAVRVGAYLGLEPESVYMHAGVRQGLRALEDAHTRWALAGSDRESANGPGKRAAMAKRLPGKPPWYKEDRVQIRYFPRPLRDMDADEVEDILCTYREVFDRWHR